MTNGLSHYHHLGESAVIIRDIMSDFESLILNSFFYAPNFEEVEGAYWFGSVRAVQ